MTKNTEIFNRASLSPEQQEALDNQLLDAAQKGKIEEVRALLDRGKKDPAVSLRDQHSDNAIVKLLLDHGQTPDDPAKSLRRKLADAEIVKLLLNRGQNDYVVNPIVLYLAAVNGHTDTAHLLLERGADVVKAGGKDLIAECNRRGHTQVAELLEYHMPEQKEKRAMEKEAAGIRSPFPTMWRSNKPQSP